ncbi:DeoR/GlpR family DNA-binding transcription regulator [Rhodococcus kroppenstedtii]|uniref:Lactose phosphotransferase system repressor n=1 Tax=Rhodococcoides kroppenstedtii TaxID=293050 RepID=A0A1I0TCZ6_9NOCA|nr:MULTISPECIES: DeoR/GlpR family DNA-binding transcription regulator [Rhodococcus]AMY18867.1 HTH-type transcriptional repressor GlcR [Rhodococcus sp. PBTS 1]MBT1192531.1 DeoR/GlpR transcriptional regulator [Rhodococcus kroppenstedtii]MBY6311976.1 DeoR/GlpR transcriptional regulator [Rhodococcus kroppenstedtii]MBY6319560.1 DeoR/GlpR transcriptional regulator [Rhodococcus kroppenstedtii]MBY6398243.1 DeoR/GlpR transcriptional regulator [Rhodococcus kroppenstedtii]
MYAEERQNAIAGLIGQRGRVSVADLADTFGVTTETVRRDLAALDRMGVVRRVHGGAVPVTTIATVEKGLAEREHTRTQEKDRIAAAAVRFLPDAGGSVALDAGTTTGRLAALVPVDVELTVVTNSLPIAQRLATVPSLSLHLAGGRVRGVTQATVGEDAVRTFTTLRVDVAFLGTNALSVAHGLSTPDTEEAAVKRAMAAAADRVVVVADSAKIGLEYFMSFAALDGVDVLVTDDGITDADCTRLQQHGLEVVVA